MFEKPKTTADWNIVYMIRKKVKIALEEEKRRYKNYFKERVNIIQRLVSALPEEAGQKLLKKIIR